MNKKNKNMNVIERIARKIVASENIGKSYYHIMDEDKKLISVIFNIANNAKRDVWMGWMDSMLQKPGELEIVAKKYGFVFKQNTMDVGVHLDGAMFSLCYQGGADADMEGFKKELAEKFSCSEIQ